MRHYTILLIAAFLACTFSGCQLAEDLSPAERQQQETGFDEAGDTDDLRHGKAFRYTAELDALNNSGVSGTAVLTYENGMLTVEIEASGMEADQLHVQHIHGFETNNGNATCPSMSADTDGDGLVSVGEGAPFYGPVLLSLTPFPTAPADGNISYSETFEMADGVKPLQNRAIVLHGLTVDDAYVASLPVACGQISAPMPVN